MCTPNGIPEALVGVFFLETLPLNNLNSSCNGLFFWGGGMGMGHRARSGNENRKLALALASGTSTSTSTSTSSLVEPST
jgi:hypothetical protein